MKNKWNGIKISPVSEASSSSISGFDVPTKMLSNDELNHDDPEKQAPVTRVRVHKAPRIIHQEIAIGLCTHRFTLMAVAQTVVVLSLVYPSVQYNCFLFGIAYIFCSLLAKCDVHLNTVDDMHVFVKCFALFFLYCLVSILSMLGVVPVSACAVVAMVLTVPPAVYLGHSLGYNTVSYVQMAVCLLLSVVTHAVVLIVPEGRQHGGSYVIELLICICISDGLILCTQKIKDAPFIKK